MKAASTTAFLGGGNITSALLAGLGLASYKQPIIVHDRNPEKLRRLKQTFQGDGFLLDVAFDLKSAVAQADTLIIAVRPLGVAQLLDEVAHCGAALRARVAVSLAAGIPLARLRPSLATSIHWARAMPSPVCRIGHGLTALTYDRTLSQPERIRVRHFFKQVGPVLEIPERQFDAFTVVFSPSHGYHALATLAKSAKAAGLDRKTAFIAAAHALADGILYWKEAGHSLDELLQEANTPGGTAAATMAAMDKGGYQRIVSRGVVAGIKQARSNAKK